MEDDDSPSYKTKRPAPVHGDELSKALPTPEVDDCPTPMLAAITGLEKLRIREEMAQTPASVTLEPMPEEPSTAGAAKRRRARKSRAGRRAGGGGAGPKGLQAPFVLQPRTPQAHARTVIMLHGFTSTGKQLASGWLPALAKALGRRTLDTLKLVFLNAPIRTVSCYGDERPRHPAWHDYFTDHGGDEGRPDLEEEIDEEQVAWARERIHAAIDAEAAALGGDYSRVAIGGASQGCCMALDAALTHRELLGGVFASFGHVYECTARLAPYPDGRDALLISAFHGAADECIAASLALRKYADLVDLGFHRLTLRVAPSLGHCEPSDAELVAFADALGGWGFLPKPGRGEATAANDEAPAEARPDGRVEGRRTARRRRRHAAALTTPPRRGREEAE